jgi:hypothetical protein
LRSCNRALVCSTFVLLLLAEWTHAQDFEIKFDRPLKAGMKYRMNTSSSGKMSLTAKVNGELVMNRPSVSSSDLQADVLVVAVDGKGKATRLEFTIRKFVQTRNGTETEVLPPGAVVVVASTGTNRPDFSLKDGSPVSPALSKELYLLRTSADMLPQNFDQFFGTRERKTPGDEWPIDMKQATALTLLPPEMPEEFKTILERAKFTVRLNGVEKHNSMDCLNISVQFCLTFDETIKEMIQKIVQKTPKSAQSAEEATIENWTTSGASTLLCPVDITAPIQGVRASGKIEMQTRMKDAEGKETVVNLSIDHTAAEQRTFEDPPAALK